MSTIRRIGQQSFRIPPPLLTEKNLPSQIGKVHIVTGGYAGVGQELVKILYSKHAIIYLAGRSKDKGLKSIKSIEEAFPGSKGKLHFLLVDLSNLATIKQAAEEFMSKESQLNVLTNNAGIMMPPKGSKDTQGHELQIGTNCLGPFLFTLCLMPLMKKTAANSPPGTVRVTWPASMTIEMSPKNGIQFEPDGSVRCHNNPQDDYAQSKVGSIFLAAEAARRYGDDGVVSVAFNPGNLSSELQRHMGSFQSWFYNKTVLHPPVNGAYTELYAGWSVDIDLEHNGSYVIPWGRFGKMRPDLYGGTKRIDEGGLGTAERFWEWCEKTTKPYA